MSSPIVVGIDTSEGSRRSLAWALAEARLRGGHVRAVMAWSFLDQPAERFDPDYGEAAARDRLEAFVKEVARDAHDVPIELVVVNDLPARALLDASRDAELVVVGSRGLGGFRGLLLGSVSHQVVQHARCPVVVLPGDERLDHEAHGDAARSAEHPS